MTSRCNVEHRHDYFPLTEVVVQPYSVHYALRVHVYICVVCMYVCMYVDYFVCGEPLRSFGSLRLIQLD